MSMKRTNLVTVRSWLSRQLCTVSLVEAAEAAATAESLASTASPRKKPETLYRKLSALGATGESATTTLNEFVMEGKRMSKDELRSCVKELRSYRRFHHALEIMDWMEKRKFNFSPGDYAIQLDLIAKTKGIVAAENFFSRLSLTDKNQMTFGALLNCYCKELMTDKALDTYNKMDELGYLTHQLPFHNLMSLYVRSNQPEKVPRIVQEMKDRKVAPSTLTYNMWMQSYGHLDDLEGVERVVKEMKENAKSLCDWTTFTNLATIYLKAGLVDKVESALKDAEATLEPSDGRRQREAYHFLISLYAGVSNLTEVNRVWELLKLNLKTTTNMSYLIMLQALANLKDIQGLRRCFEEWKSCCLSYDMRLADVVIRAFLEHDMLEEAILVFEDALKRIKKPPSKAREMFMEYFLRTNQLSSALEHLREALSEAKDKKWHLSAKIITAFFNSFVKEKDVEGSEKFCKVLKHIDCLDANAYKLLLNTYVSADRLAPEIRQRLEEENVATDDELENLLQKVCPN